MGEFKLLHEMVKDWIKIERNLYLNKKKVLIYLEHNEEKINDLFNVLEIIKKNKKYQPSIKEIQNEYAWEIELYKSKLYYHSGSGPIASKNFESNLDLITMGNNYETIIKSLRSNNVNDVYIHLIDIDNLEKLINNL